MAKSSKAAKENNRSMNAEIVSRLDRSFNALVDFEAAKSLLETIAKIKNIGDLRSMLQQIEIEDDQPRGVNE